MGFHLNISDASFAKMFKIVGIVFIIFNSDIKGYLRYKTIFCNKVALDVFFI